MKYKTKLSIAFSLNMALYVFFLGLFSAALLNNYQTTLVFTSQFEAVIIVGLAIVSLYLLFDIFESMQTYEILESRKRRIICTVCGGGFIGTIITLFYMYVPLALGIVSRSTPMCINKFNEALPEFIFFFVIALPAIIYITRKTLKFYWNDNF